jgi:ADP-ribosylglycohydrolase
MRSSRIKGSLVGLAVGDALGYPAEFRTRRQLQEELGPEGITGFIRLKDARFSRPFILGPDHPPGTFTDDTQMSLCVAEALIAAGHADRDTLMRGERLISR